MDGETVRQVRRRAEGRCEYCQLPSAAHPAPFQTDHIIAKQHGGVDELGNLALACIHCNRYKGPNIAGIDPDTGELTRLFHPRTDEWNSHFAWNGAEIVPLTAIGRVTLGVLLMNDPELIWMRSNLTSETSWLVGRRAIASRPIFSVTDFEKFPKYFYLYPIQPLTTHPPPSKPSP